MDRPACRVASEQLSAYLEDPAHRRAEADAAIAHMRECPYCKGGLEQLTQALVIDEEDRLTCQECLNLLPGYFQAEPAGQAGEAAWRSVAFHIKTCPHCSEAYATLSDLSALAFGERGKEPPAYPAPDLSFLRPKLPEIPWHLDELGRLIIELSAEVVRAFQPPFYQPAFATTGLKSGQSRGTLCQLSLKEAIKDKDMEVSITAEEMKKNTTLCAIIVEVNIPSRGGWPHLAGTEVIIRRGEMQLSTQLTDAFGKAIFKDIATGDLARLTFEIKPGD
jgi:glutaredoxin